MGMQTQLACRQSWRFQFRFSALLCPYLRPLPQLGSRRTRSRLMHRRHGFWPCTPGRVQQASHKFYTLQGRLISACLHALFLCRICLACGRAWLYIRIANVSVITLFALVYVYAYALCALIMCMLRCYIAWLSLVCLGVYACWVRLCVCLHLSRW